MWFAPLILAGVIGGLSGFTKAQEITAPVGTSTDVAALVERLQQAESRIHQLEIQRLPATDPQIFDGYTSLADGDDKEEIEGEEKAEDEVAQRLKKLEEAWEKQQEADDKKAAAAAKKPTHKWTGRVHADYWHFPSQDPLNNFLDTGNPNFEVQDFVGFRRLRLGLAGDIPDNMRYKIEFDFASPNNLAFKDAYLGWEELPFFHTVLLGQQKRPYGLDHLNSSRYNVFMERPFAVEAYNQDARRFGIQSYGVSLNEAWNWRYGAFLMRDLQQLGGQRSDDHQIEVAGRLANTIWYDESSDGRGYAHWAVSGSYAMPHEGDQARFRSRPESRTASRWIETGAIANAHTYSLLGFESVVNVGAFSLVGEYQLSSVDRTVGQNINTHGGYFYAGYWLTGEHTPWSRSSGTIGRTKPFENFFLVNTCNGGRCRGMGAWQIAARYSYGDFTDGDVFGNVGEAVTVGLNWWWNPNARMQFNYIHGQIRNVSPATAAIAGDEGDYDVFATRFMVDF